MSSRNSKNGNAGKTAPAASAPATAGFSPEKVRIIKIIEETSSNAPVKFQPYIKQAAPFLASAWLAFMIALPYIILFVKKAAEIYAKLPEKIVMVILGLFICFFGGVFPATIAAVEAWRLCGGSEAIASCKQLYIECDKVYTESKKDDTKDEDGDGIADVNQIDAKALVARKTALALKTVDPGEVNKAIVCIYTGWMGVVATLKIKFAMVVTLGHVIGTKMYGVIHQFEPAIQQHVPEEYSKWVPYVMQWICKAVAVTLAWWVQRLISCFHSAIRGSFMASQYLVEYLKETKGIDLDGKLGKDVFPWGLAALGVLVQFIFGFSIPFPLNLFTWPINIVEYFVVFSVAGGSDSTV